MEALTRIKQLVWSGRVVFTEKALLELEADGLERQDVYESIMTAPAVSKVLSSRDPMSRRRENLYVIKGQTFDGVPVYTKGKISGQGESEVFYVFISSKRSTDV